MDTSYKEVMFGTYCATCKYRDKKENEFPCDECLMTSVRYSTDKPEKWEERE